MTVNVAATTRLTITGVEGAPQRKEMCQLLFVLKQLWQAALTCTIHVQTTSSTSQLALSAAGVSESKIAHVTLSNFEEMKVDDLLHVASEEADHPVTELNIVTQTGRHLDYTSSDMLLQDIFQELSLLSAASAAGVSARA